MVSTSGHHLTCRKIIGWQAAGPVPDVPANCRHTAMPGTAEAHGAGMLEVIGDERGMQWLEQHLDNYPRTVVAVTHDRYFMDNVAGWNLELDRGQA